MCFPGLLGHHANLSWASRQRPLSSFHHPLPEKWCRIADRWQLGRARTLDISSSTLNISLLYLYSSSKTLVHLFHSPRCISYHHQSLSPGNSFGLHVSYHKGLPIEAATWHTARDQIRGYLYYSINNNRRTFNFGTKAKRGKRGSYYPQTGSILA